MAQATQITEQHFPNNIHLLQLYKAEKADMDFPSSPFMPFKEWKEMYKAEWMDSHCTSKSVDAETAINLTDAEMNEMDNTTSTKTEKKVVVRKIKSTPKIKVKKEKVPTKAERALEIYQEMMVDGNHPVRKEVIQRFMNELNMSVAGASTYQYNIKKKLSQ